MARLQKNLEKEQTFDTTSHLYFYPDKKHFKNKKRGRSSLRSPFTNAN